MTSKVTFTPAARSQFIEALAYVHADSPSAAATFRQKAESSLARLRDFPDLPFREVIVGPYRFFYRVKAETVWIVAVWHGAQLPDEPEDVGSG